jgi:rare lipoprotein A (peptidoglycan hydrolase)
MANGKLFDPDLPIIASWDYDFHTVLELYYEGRVVRGVVLDRGPARRLYHKGRKLDISESLFRKLVGNTDAGVVEVKYRALNNMEVQIKW